VQTLQFKTNDNLTINNKIKDILNCILHKKRMSKQNLFRNIQNKHLKFMNMYYTEQGILLLFYCYFR